jgi:hypothetical protein
MVWLAREDLVGAEELLEQHHSREPVRERERAEREPTFGAAEHRLVEPERPTHEEAEIACRAAPFLEEARQPFAREQLALAVEGAQKSAVWHARQRRARLLPQRLTSPREVAARFADLEYLDPGVPPEEALVVRDVVGEGGSAEPSDANDRDPHGAILEGPPPAARTLSERPAGTRSHEKERTP